MTTQPTLDELMEELQQQLQIVLKALEGAQAEMVAAVLAEREACAKAAEAEKFRGEIYKDFDYGYNQACEDAATAIRARGGSSN